MRSHAQIAVDADCEIYFCDPHAPWQRGSNENTNGLLRQYFPKGTSLAGHTPQHLAAVADELNGLPRKTLGWKTPAEALAEVLDSQRRLSRARSRRWRLAPPLISRRGAAQCPGPPLRPPGCSASPAATALRAYSGPRRPLRPLGGRHQGPGPRACPARARHPGTLAARIW